MAPVLDVEYEHLRNDNDIAKPTDSDINLSRRLSVYHKSYIDAPGWSPSLRGVRAMTNGLSPGMVFLLKSLACLGSS
jgi:hypothetical protein